MATSPTSSLPAAVYLIVLAAGLGRRMGALTAERPKALIEVGLGVTLIEENLRTAFKNLPNLRVLVCGGHGFDKLRRVLNGPALRSRTELVYNPNYATKGPLESLQLCLAHLATTPGPTIVTNGDTLYSPHVFRRLGLRLGAQAQLGVSRVCRPSPDDLIVRLDKRGRVTSASKVLMPSGVALVSAGILSVPDLRERQALQSAINIGLRKERQSGLFEPWHSALGIFSRRHDLSPLEVSAASWFEFDTPECLAHFSSARAEPDDSRVALRS